ncbi:MAG: type I 3-dehydroquinate dehydratase [Nitrosarchaeum sp.]|nr:type I 3-dehydroquinate dehydratase [Nitrosarchaeum sp.]MCA9820013.1 type I 3-dehydroquinate dehydratase [Nitrosarchaeum sp.]
MKYRTCVSIAEKSPQNLKKNLKLALKKSDYVEIRLDFLKAEQIPKALEMIKHDLRKTVCTLRPKTEGGQFNGTEKERVSILKLMAEYNPFLLDIEFNTITKNSDLRNYLKKSKTKVLVSWHDFKKTPSSMILTDMLKKMTKISSTVKIVTTARSIDDSTRVLQLYRKKGKTNLIAFSMGELGRMSRILCLYLGSPYTYVSLGKPIASGQFSIDEVNKIISI